MYQNNRPTNGTPGNKPVDLRAKFQLPPQPASVQKIAGLSKGRESASMDEIAEIISTESGVTQRLMSIAYPKAAARLGATVQMATSRLGVNKVIVVLVGDLLTKAVHETFETMVGMPLEQADPQTVSMPDYKFLTSAVRFAGQANGQVTLAFSAHLSLVLAAQLLGGDIEEHTPEAINDVIGELVNIVTGNLQSKLCDAGLTSEVGLPEVKFETVLPTEAVPGGSSDHFFFHCGTHTLAVCLSIDPSAKKTRMAPSTQGNTWRANGL
jgi:CheY-specific phosphatase CheX